MVRRNWYRPHFAKRSMKISSELNIDSAHVHQLGIRALTQIVSLPEETREENNEHLQEN